MEETRTYPKMMWYNKDNGKYEKTPSFQMGPERATDIYKRLADELISKYINKGLWTRSVKRINRYDGTQEITLYQDNGKLVFIIEN